MLAVLDVGVAVQAECGRFLFKQAWVVAGVRVVALQAQAGVDRGMHHVALKQGLFMATDAQRRHLSAQAFWERPFVQVRHSSDIQVLVAGWTAHVNGRVNRLVHCHRAVAIQTI